MKLPSFNQPPVVPAVENKKSLAEEFTKEEIIQGLSIPDKNIVIDDYVFFDKADSVILSSFGLPETFVGDLRTANITLLKKEAEKLNFAGAMELYFGESKKGERIIYVAKRKLFYSNQKSGLGLDIECQLENFCKKHKIATIYNIASSQEEGDVGAYVWAKYGYEFADKNAINRLRQTMMSIAGANNITLLVDAKNLKRPLDFANVKGKNNSGEEVNFGKEFLLNNEIAWDGKRDLTPGSQGTKDFIAYLKERGREDLIEKYYADEK